MYFFRTSKFTTAMKCTIFLLVPILFTHAAPLPTPGTSGIDIRQLDPLSLIGGLTSVVPLAGGVGGGSQERRELDVSPRQVDIAGFITGLVPVAGLLGGDQDSRRELDVSVRQLDVITTLLGAITGGGAAQESRRGIGLSDRQDLNNLLNSLPVFGGDGATSLYSDQPARVSARQDLTTLVSGLLGGLGGSQQDSAAAGSTDAVDTTDTTAAPTPNMAARQLLGGLLDSIFGGSQQDSTTADTTDTTAAPTPNVAARQLLSGLLGGILGGSQQDSTTADTTDTTDTTTAPTPNVAARQLFGDILSGLTGRSQQDITDTTDNTTPPPNVVARQDIAATILDPLLGIPLDEDTRRKRQLQVSTDLSQLTSLLSGVLPPAGGTGTQEARDTLSQELANRQLDLGDLFGNIFDGLSSRGFLPRQILDPVDYLIGIIPPPLGVTPNDA